MSGQSEQNLQVTSSDGTTVTWNPTDNPSYPGGDYINVHGPDMHVTVVRDSEGVTREVSGRVDGQKLSNYPSK